MAKGNQILFGVGVASVLLLTGCPLQTHPPVKHAPTAPPPAPGGIIPNTRLNPVFTIESELPDPFVYVDTVRSQAPMSISLAANGTFQSLVENYSRVKFPQIANPANTATGGPKIVVWLTYLDLSPRWEISQIFGVVAMIDFKVDVKIHGAIYEQEFHASGQGMRDNAFQDAMNAAMRNAIPELDHYLSTLNL